MDDYRAGIADFYPAVPDFYPAVPDLYPAVPAPYPLSFPPSTPVIPAKAGIQTIADKPATRNQA